MADFKLNETFQQIKTLINEMPLMKKLSILVTLGVAVGAILILVQLANQTSYQAVFTGLKGEDMGSVTSALEKSKIPYQIQSETQSVLVPGDRVLEARLKLAKEGLPKIAGVGFELFDEKSFGMTDFEQRLNYQRALQGELIRTINEISEVEDTRIHLVMPERTLFNQTRERPSASVVIKLSQGQNLDEGTVQSIVHLVSASVANLDPKDVTVVDTNGNLLTSPDGENGNGMASNRHKQDAESVYEGKIKSLLEPVVGYNKVQVRVTADLDFTEKETTEEKFDPESIAVRSESRTKNKETSSGGGGAGGVPGAASATATSSAGGSDKNKDEANESISYEVSKQVQRIVSPIGEVKKLSIAVVVDGNYTANPDGTSTYAARTPEEIKNFEDIIKSAIGFDDKRGDQIKVINLAFQSPAALFATTPDFWSTKSSYSFYLSVIINLVIGIMALLIILFVVRPVIAAWNANRAGAAGTPALADGSPLMLQAGQVREELQRKAVDDPANMVNVLRSWLE